MDIITMLVPYLIMSAVVFIIGVSLVCGIALGYARGYERV